jgi:hypothetical protein
MEVVRAGICSFTPTYPICTESNGLSFVIPTEGPQLETLLPFQTKKEYETIRLLKENKKKNG